MNLQSYLQSRKKSEVMLIAVGLTTLVGVLDYLTGPLSFTIFYLVPVALAAWFAGKQAGLGVALISAVFWFAIDTLWPVVPLPLAVHIWNAAVRFGFFIVVVLLLAKLKALRISLEQRVAERTASLTVEIAERKRLEAAAKLQFAQLASDKMWDAAYWIGQDGRFVYVNAAACRQLGHTREEMLALNITDLDPDMTPERWAQGWHETKLMQHRIFEARHRAKDGRLLSVELTVSHLEAGEQEYHFSIARDLTTRKQWALELERVVQERTQELQAAQQQLKNIYNSSQDAIGYVDLNGHLLDFNHAFEVLTGYDATELRQMTYQQLTPAEYTVADTRAAESVIRTGQAVRYEKQYLRKDGTRVPVALTTFIVRDQAGQPTGLAAIIRDVTEQYQLQREILEISDRERRRIGQDLHDDLCQMLAGITFATGSLEERLTADNSPAAGTVHEIGELLQRANREAHNIARGLYPAELEAGGLPMALQRLADDITRTGKARCELLCDANVVIHDQAQALHIYRIVQEAVANALRHGLATVISITLEVADGLIYLEVANNGRDWPAEIAKTSGMGLNIMAYRARMIGGTLQICRGETGGTVVDLTLPASSGT